MAHIIVTAESSRGREVAMLAERVPVGVLQENRAADQLDERIAGDARTPPRREPPDRSLPRSVLSRAPGDPPSLW